MSLSGEGNNNTIRNSDGGAAVTQGSQLQPPKTKFCHIVKRADFEGYGFNLHSEKIKPGQYIGKVDKNSPAEAAGLCEGDRIMEVNASPIDGETHKQVVQRIKAIACEVRLLVVDASTIGTDATNADRKLKATTIATENGSSNGNVQAHSSVQEVPGTSANITSITVKSTKRAAHTGNDEPDRAISSRTTHSIVNGNETAAEVLPAKAEEIATRKSDERSNASTMQVKLPSPAAMVATVPVPSLGSTPRSNGSAVVGKTGGLHLPMTAAEMRAQLMARKKYDPKNESIDLKKKFDIIQKL